MLKNKNKNPIFVKNMQEENNTHGLEKPAEILLKNQKLERHENCNVEMRPSSPNAAILPRI